MACLSRLINPNTESHISFLVIFKNDAASAAGPCREADYKTRLMQTFFF